jgi:predicted lipoprotein with Yx(FWY)xxD motif
MSKALFTGVLATIAMAVVACGESTASTGGSPQATVGTATIAAASNATLGEILVDGTGRTVYLFVADTGTTSACYGACAQYWPPVLTSGAAVAGSGVTASLLGTITRTDGTTEVTYSGHPLYYVITDKKPGDTTGQAVNNYGAPWFVVGPDGKQIG